MAPTYDAEFCLIRTPLRSIDHVSRFFSTLKNNGGAPASYFREFFSDPIAMEALYVASPDLYEQAKKYFNGEIHKERAIKKIEVSLYEYMVRMCTRCTPFGLFAGCAIGTFGRSNNIHMAPVESFTRFVRMDMDYACSAIKNVLLEPAVIKKLHYHINSSLYKIKNCYRYTEYGYKKHMRSHRLVEVESTAVLNRLIAKARHDIAYHCLVNEVIEMGYDHEDAEAYVDELISSQVLINELDANVTGQEYVSRLLDIARKRGIGHETISVLARNQRLLEGIDRYDDKISAYKHAIGDLKTITPELNPGKTFQMDMITKTVSGEVNEAVKQEVLEAIEALRLLNNFDIQRTKFEHFKKAFFEKYEFAAVKLTEALDAEVGIDYDNMSTSNPPAARRAEPDMDVTMKLKLEKYNNSLQQQRYSVDISPADLAALNVRRARTGDSFSVIIQIFKEAEQEKIRIKNVYGGGAAGLLGRFCFSDSLLVDKMIGVTQQEQELQPDLIFAEIAHLPQSRLGNILKRPHLRDYEIPYLCNSTLEGEKQIHIDDLYLQIKEDGGKLALYSKRLKKEIMPKLSSAHNYTFQSMPVYAFLCEMQLQYIHYVYQWDWGLLSSQKFLPRVTYKNTILQVAHWNLALSDLATPGQKPDEAALKKGLQLFREKWSMPAFVQLSENDNELLLNLDEDFCARYLLQALEKDGQVRIREYIWQENSTIARDSNGLPLPNEVILPFVNKVPREKTEQRNGFHMSLNSHPRRKFHIGSEWLYFKIYTRATAIDKILHGGLYMLMKNLTRSGVSVGWFFIRYSDPRPHLRLRIKLSDKSNVGIIISQVSKVIEPYLSSGVISGLNIDSYTRELERYGFNTIEIAESIFWRNSLLACELSRLLPGEQYRNLRLLSGMHYINYVLGLTDFSQDERIAFCNDCFKAYAQEHALDTNKKLKDTLKDGYRESLPLIKGLFGTSNGITLPEKDGILKALTVPGSAHEDDWRMLMVKLKKSAKPSLNKTIRDHIHMFYNRLMEDSQRTAELKVYDYLYKFYRSQQVQQSLVAANNLDGHFH
jgi:lantibiotic biosynthesis protein